MPSFIVVGDGGKPYNFAQNCAKVGKNRVKCFEKFLQFTYKSD